MKKKYKRVRKKIEWATYKWRERTLHDPITKKLLKIKETQQNECLLVSKSDLREVGSTITPFVILVYKEALFSTNDLPSTLPCAVFDLL
jgi:hypothetical protein